MSHHCAVTSIGITHNFLVPRRCGCSCLGRGRIFIFHFASTTFMSQHIAVLDQQGEVKFHPSDMCLVSLLHTQCHLLVELDPCKKKKILWSFYHLFVRFFFCSAYCSDLFIQSDLRTSYSLFLTDPELWAQQCTSNKDKIHFVRAKHTAGNHPLSLETLLQQMAGVISG